MHYSKRDIDRWDTYRKDWKNNKDVEEAIGSFDRYSPGDSSKLRPKLRLRLPPRNPLPRVSLSEAQTIYTTLGASIATSNARDVTVGTISNQPQHIRSTTIGRTITAVYTATAIHNILLTRYTFGGLGYWLETCM